MDTSELSRSPSGSNAKRHSRNISYSNRTPLTRRTTKGPLDVEDPLGTAPPSEHATPSTAEAASIPIPPTAPTASKPNPLLPSQSHAARPRSRSPLPLSTKDLSFLLRQSNFRRVSQTDIPLPFRSTPAAPGTSLPALLRQGHFYRAALLAVSELVAPSSNLRPKQIFELLYTRLACLTLLDQTPLAGKESLALGDIHSPFYISEENGECILPWELRVLAVRLQGLGAGDARRGVQGYYDLAVYARVQIRKTKEAAVGDMWRERLRDLGIRVGNALIEMPDLEAGRRHFESLVEATTDEEEKVLLKSWLAMLCLRMADIASARAWIGAEQGDDQEADEAADSTTTLSRKGRQKQVLNALLSIAEGSFEAAASQWRILLAEPRYTVLAQQNLAVCLLYTGRIDETSNILSKLIEEGNAFHALTFNLATLHELSTNHSREKKVELAEKVAEGLRKAYDDAGAVGEGGRDWMRMERANVDFKL